MVFVVRKRSEDGQGEDCCSSEPVYSHAAIGAYKQLMSTQPAAEVVSHWENTGCTKVVVKAPDEQTLLDVRQHARELGLNTHVVRDAGRTQIAPGSKTVLCIGPGPVEKVDTTTGHLKLL
ncbi:peptidyl-tRNA hydrolase 2, mitochondrial-like [Halichondria panicea]|uniref:peptidyl-tRNA hydrolase 2, mitochondrial-like n=1 Tax=Halichondria panicea TaxID=6063 RepID=UPI00312B824F